MPYRSITPSGFLEKCQLYLALDLGDITQDLGDVQQSSMSTTCFFTAQQIVPWMHSVRQPDRNNTAWNWTMIFSSTSDAPIPVALTWSIILIPSIFV